MSSMNICRVKKIIWNGITKTEMGLNMNITVIGGADGPTSIFLAGKFGHLFMIFALLILIWFYGVYFIKKAAQRHSGIRTSQLGRGHKKKDLRVTEIFLSIATILIVPAELVSILTDWSGMSAWIRIIGVMLGFAGDLVFMTAVLTMKNSWRAGIPDADRTEFVSHGIYRYSRNPAFLGFDLMYVGILLLYFNWMLMIFTVWAAVMLHLQILQEEKYLAETFGEDYLEYKKCTRRYLGRKKST